MKSYDVAIIGGGILGITLEFFLSRLGQRVIVLEQGSLATQTTANSLAWVNSSSKAAQGHYHQLNARGLSGYNQLSQEFGEEALGYLQKQAAKLLFSQLFLQLVFRTLRY